MYLTNHESDRNKAGLRMSGRIFEIRMLCLMGLPQIQHVYGAILPGGCHEE